jgi:peptide/nickel transport system ATP-binding protein
MPSGCAFHPRCAKCFERCTRERPEPRPVGANLAACWLYE